MTNSPHVNRFPLPAGTLLILTLTCVMSLAGCHIPPSTDYSAYLNHVPKTILVLPPVNHTANVHASDAYLATVTTPLAECGYYVYPIAVIDRLFKDNGVPTPGDMHQITLAKIDEIIGPDAVLYINIRQWTTTYVVINSTSKVTCDYKLVDVKSGATLWEITSTYAHSSGGGSLAGMIVNAAVDSIVNAISNGGTERKVAAQANFIAFYDVKRGLIKGTRHPKHDTDLERARLSTEKAKQQAQTQKLKAATKS